MFGINFFNTVLSIKSVSTGLEWSGSDRLRNTARCSCLSIACFITEVSWFSMQHSCWVPLNPFTRFKFVRQRSTVSPLVACASGLSSSALSTRCIFFLSSSTFFYLIFNLLLFLFSEHGPRRCFQGQRWYENRLLFL